MSVVHSHLHRIAQKHLNRERPDHTLQPTAVATEAYLQVVDQHDQNWQNRAHFFAAAAQAMQAECDKFNATHKVGDKIKCWTGHREVTPVERIIREPGAVVLSGHTPVVYVSGGGGCVALTHVA